jgi:hypothetical protein
MVNDLGLALNDAVSLVDCGFCAAFCSPELQAVTEESTDGLDFGRILGYFSSSFSSCHCKNICCCFSKSSYAVCSLVIFPSEEEGFDSNAELPIPSVLEVSSSKDELDFFIRFGPLYS